MHAVAPPPAEPPHGGAEVAEGTQTALLEYIAMACRDKCTPKDFDESAIETLSKLPIFMALQVVRRFNDGIGPRIVNRNAFFFGILRSTSRWWTAEEERSHDEGTSSPFAAGSSTIGEAMLPPSSPRSAPHLKFMVHHNASTDGPNTNLIINLCQTGRLSPDVFNPEVCRLLQTLPPPDVSQVVHNFGKYSIALLVADDSHYAKQQLFLSLLRDATTKSAARSASVSSQQQQQQQQPSFPPTQEPASTSSGLMEMPISAPAAPPSFPAAPLPPAASTSAPVLTPTTVRLVTRRSSTVNSPPSSPPRSPDRLKIHFSSAPMGGGSSLAPRASEATSPILLNTSSGGDKPVPPSAPVVASEPASTTSTTIQAAQVNERLAEEEEAKAKDVSAVVALQAAEIGRLKSESESLSKLASLRLEFVARTLAAARLAESCLDEDARLALSRVPLLVAMQTMEHFVSSSKHRGDQLERPSAFLVGILSAKDRYWRESRTASFTEGGAETLLDLPPSFLLRFVHLCLDGNCRPTDISPETALEIKRYASVDDAIEALERFNANKRVVSSFRAANAHPSSSSSSARDGKIYSRSRFFGGILRNARVQEAQPSSPRARGHVGELNSGWSSSSELEGDLTGTSEGGVIVSSPTQQNRGPLNPKAKPFTPSGSKATSPQTHSPVLTATRVTPETSSGGLVEVTNDAASEGTKGAMESNEASTTNLPNGTSALTVLSGPETAAPSASLEPPLLTSSVPHAKTTLATSIALTTTPAAATTTSPPPAPSNVAGAPPSRGSGGLSFPTSTMTEQERLHQSLDSSRDAIAHLTSQLARARTGEIRLRRELNEAKDRIEHLLTALEEQRQESIQRLESLSRQIIMNVSMSFEQAAASMAPQTPSSDPDNHLDKES